MPRPACKTKKPLFHLMAAFFTKDLLQDFFRDEWFQQAVALKDDVTLIELRQLHRNGGSKKSQDALYRVRRTAPDAEETENVVNAKRIEVIAHLCEPMFPPREAVLLHARPVVGRKSPVLPFHSESVRRRTGLRVGMEKFRLLPDIRAVAINADRDVAL